MSSSAVSTSSAAGEISPSSPSPASAATVTAAILRIYGVFLCSTSLSPSPTVNAAFSELVSLCIRPYDGDTVAAILADRRVCGIAADLRGKCSEGEYELELWWAGRLLQGGGTGVDATWEALRAFPYFQNYMDLSRLELAALAAVRGSAIGSLAFVGSGPLPLTSICLSTLLSPAPRRIHNVDSCPRAIALSRELCGRLRVPLTFEHADARDVALDEFDVVVLAGLVGANADEKARILGNVVRSCRQDALLVLRSAHGLRTLLYQEIDAARLRALGLDVLLVVNPWNDVVNSVVVCRVAARARL